MPGSALIGNLAVNLTLETAAFQSGATIAEKRVQKLSASFESVGKKLTAGGAILSAAITAPFVSLVSKAIPAALESRQAIGQVNAALASMGPVAGKTSDQLQKAAAALQHISTFDDDEILKKVTANMLTFGNISGQAFDRAQLAAVNLSARLGQDLQSSAIQVGKALNDPVKGLTALQRVGIQFTASQKEMIKGFVDTGNVAAAQNIILGELERQFGGAAKAARDASPGSDLQEKWRTFQEVIGEIALKVLPPLTDMLTKVLDAFNRLSPATQAWVVGIAAVGAALGPVLLVVGPLTIGLGALLPVLVKLGPLFVALGRAVLGLAIAGGPITLAIAAAAALYLAFKNWDAIKGFVQNMVTGVADAIRGKLTPLLDNAKARIHEITDAFRMMYEKVVGHSYVPDMVEGIASEFARLGQVMVDPSIDATMKVQAAFETLQSVLGKILGERTGGIFSMITGMVAQFAPLVGNLLGGGLGKSIFPVVNGVDPLAPLPATPGFALGGSMKIGGAGGIDRNLLSLNGKPLARVSRGETLNVANDAQPSVVVNQHNNFAGGAVTQTDLLRMHQVTVAASTKAINEQRRRG